MAAGLVGLDYLTVAIDCLTPLARMVDFAIKIYTPLGGNPPSMVSCCPTRYMRESVIRPHKINNPELHRDDLPRIPQKVSNRSKQYLLFHPSGYPLL